MAHKRRVGLAAAGPMVQSAAHPPDSGKWALHPRTDPNLARTPEELRGAVFLCTYFFEHLVRRGIVHGKAGPRSSSSQHRLCPPVWSRGPAGKGSVKGRGVSSGGAGWRQGLPPAHRTCTSPEDGSGNLDLCSTINTSDSEPCCACLCCQGCGGIWWHEAVGISSWGPSSPTCLILSR